MLKDRIEAVSAHCLHAEFIKTRNVENARIEKFEGVDGLDVYNPSVPFVWEGKEYIAGRVERRDSERSQVRFFEHCGEEWKPAEGTAVLPLQDPFVTFIDGKLLLGGVNVTWPKNPGEGASWQTDFYIGSPFELKKVLSGPKQMKDIRIVQLPDGKIAVASRPQGASMEKYGCIAKIGFTVVDSLDALTPEIIENAPFIEQVFLNDEWGGANQLTVLKNGLIGVIGHKAYRTYEEDGQRLHYYGIAFAIDPKTRRLTQDKMIISGDCFPKVDGKRRDLCDITFTAGILRLGGGQARVFTGLNDTHVGSAMIPDPFEEFEKL